MKNFEPIENTNFPKLPDDIVDDLSSDQYYGYPICLAVMSGYLDLICKSFRSALLLTQDGWLWPAAFFVFIHQQNSLQKVWCNWPKRTKFIPNAYKSSSDKVWHVENVTKYKQYKTSVQEKMVKNQFFSKTTNTVRFTKNVLKKQI